MPGHIKKSEGPDPDPAHWLYVSYELKEKNKVQNGTATKRSITQRLHHKT